MANEKLTDTDVSAIDKALAAAKKRAADKKGTTSTTTEGSATPKTAKAPKEKAAPKRPRLTDEEKAARTATRDKERAEKKAARDAARQAKKAEKDANKQPAHMRKVLKAAEKLGNLGESAQLIFNEATANLPQAELANLALHIQHFNRVKATERSSSQELSIGQQVTIVGGDPRFIGKTGTVAKAQRIRCYVTVEGFKKDIYLFTADVRPVEAANEAAPAQAAG